MTLRPLIGALALSLLLVACGGQDDHAEAGHGHEGEEHGAEEAARGEHGAQGAVPQRSRPAAGPATAAQATPCASANRDSPVP